MCGGEEEGSERRVIGDREDKRCRNDDVSSSSLVVVRQAASFSLRFVNSLRVVVVCSKNGFTKLHDKII